MIKKITKHEYDAWDSLIASAPNGLPYAYSWYLDIVCSGGWAGLMEEDGSSLMPVPFGGAFFGFRQMPKRPVGYRRWVVQPLFCQQLGVFAERPIDKTLLQNFTDALLLRFPNIFSYCFNETCDLTVLEAARNLRKRTNYVLSLEPAYEALRRKYSLSHRRALKKSAGLIFEEEALELSTFLSLHRKYVGKRAGLSRRAYAKWGQLIREIKARDMGSLVSVRTPDGKLAAAAFILHSHGRIIYQGGYAVGEQKALNPMHALLDTLIRRHAGSKLLLDFEGSDIPSVAEFFRRFGAEARPYGLLYT